MYMLFFFGVLCCAAGITTWCERTVAPTLTLPRIGFLSRDIHVYSTGVSAAVAAVAAASAGAVAAASDGVSHNISQNIPRCANVSARRCVCVCVCTSWVQFPVGAEWIYRTAACQGKIII